MLLGSTSPRDLHEVIERMRERPAMWLGSRSLDRMDAWIQGYRVAASDASLHLDPGEPPFHYFHRFVQKKLGFYESTAGWKNMILARETNDDGPALTRFYELFDEFRALGPARQIAETRDPSLITRADGTSVLLDAANGARTERTRLPTHLELRAYGPPLGVLLVMTFPWGIDEDFVGACAEDGYACAERRFGVPRDAWRALDGAASDAHDRERVRYLAGWKRRIEGG